MDTHPWQRPRSKSINLEKKFAERTTCHGLGHIVDQDVPKVRRYLWSIVTLAASVGCMIGSIQLLQYVLSFPTNIDIEIIHQDSLIFPAVTICNFNQLTKTALSEEDNRHLQTFLRIYHRKGAINKKDLELATSYFRNKTGVDFHLQNLTQDLGHRKNDIIVSCLWDDQVCGPENFTTIFTIYGNCYTFNSGAKKEGMLSQRGKGSAHGLRLVLNIEQYKYSGKLSYGSPDAGIRFAVHSTADLPEMDAEGMSIPPGMHAYASIPGADVIEGLPKPWGQCGSQKLKYFDHYSVSSCRREKEIDFILQRCGCVEPHHASSSNPVSVGINANVCPVACVQTEYNVEVSYALIPSQVVVNDISDQYNVTKIIENARNQGLNLTMSKLEFIRENFAFLDVYYKDLYLFKTIQKQASGFVAFLSDFGGQLGLFVGGSFLTMFEFFEYIYDKCFQQTKRSKREISRRMQSIREKRRPESMASSTSVRGNLSTNIHNFKVNESISSHNVRSNGIKSKFRRSNSEHLANIRISPSSID
ncbi:Acid-sensing ion channel 1 [Trichoplax sp. H2]|nr:Acid-sensing ion channel 1 [Trichoplax sp. H2]|eukprot:RDD47921.1 Acid-sensing ion channel 1 [Trichoplax sp. H2]